MRGTAARALSAGPHAVVNHRLEGGKQPLRNEDETVWVICNGEIYNYLELRAQLIERDTVFARTAIAKFWFTCTKRRARRYWTTSSGCSLLSLLDEKNNRLLAARDRFGEKPLYWAPVGKARHSFCVGMKALMPLPHWIAGSISLPWRSSCRALRSRSANSPARRP